MFLLFFMVFTLIFTLFENVLIAGISLVLLFVFLFIYQCWSKKKIVWQKTIVFVWISFLLAGLSFGVKEWMYYGYTNPSSFFFWLHWELLPSSSEKLVGTGIITDVSTQGKYIFSYRNTEYLLYSKKEYSIGDCLWMVWRMQENNHTDWFSYRTISPEVFALPIFSWSFDYGKWMKMKGWRGTIYETNALKIDVQVVWWTKQVKKNIQEKIIKYYGKNKISGLVLGMLIGDRSQIPESEYQSFINSGLVHLVAVSGGNILMIVVFLQFILFFLPFYIRLGVILLTIIGYGCVCGLDSSVFRAVLMGGISMFALFRWREVNIRRLWSISCIIMLIINPYFLAYDTGFLLSYSALIGIVYFEKSGEWKVENWALTNTVSLSPRHHVSIGIRYVYKSYLLPSIWASIGIFPSIIFFMGKINLLGIIGNLFVLPIVPFVMIYGFVSVWLYQYLRWDWLLWIEKFCVHYIYKISNLVAQYGIYFMVPWLRCKYVVLFLCVVFFVYRRITSGNQIEEINYGKQYWGINKSE